MIALNMISPKPKFQEPNNNFENRKSNVDVTNHGGAFVTEKKRLTSSVTLENRTLVPLLQLIVYWYWS